MTPPTGLFSNEDAGRRKSEMGVRAKFRCTEKSERRSVDGPEARELGQDCTVEIKLNPVTEGVTQKLDGYDTYVQQVKENRIFGLATPAGQIAMLIRNRAAADYFEVGQAYYVDFTPVEG